MAENKEALAVNTNEQGKPAEQAPAKSHQEGKPNFHQNKPFNKQDNKGFNRRDNQDNMFEEKVVAINRVTKVTKGGRHFRFAAVVVIGDKKGKVGFGTGKANEVPDAIKKAIKEAKKQLVRVPIVGTTIPHEVIGHFGAGKVMMKPAKKGTGVIAGGPVRAVIELSGLADVYTKSLGSNTPINILRAAFEGFKELRTADQIAKLRGKTPEELLG